MRVLLDTNIFIKAYETGLDGVPKKAQRILEDLGTERLVSSISLTEIAIKATISRQLVFPEDAIQEAIQDMRLTVIPYTRAHAQGLFSLPFFEDHRDPFDRMLIAVALEERIPIMSSDRHFKRYKGLQTIWK